MNELDVAAEALVQTGMLLNSATLCGNQSRKSRALYDWVATPRLGDMVVITFTRPRPAIERVGRWVATWTFCHEPDEMTPDEPLRDRAHELVYQIELLTGALFTWTNVGMIRIPASNEEYFEHIRLMEAERARA